MIEDDFDKAHPELKPKIKIPINLNGNELLEFIQNLTDEVEWFSHGMILRDSITMLYATDGIGKSLIGIQAALELASGLPVFKTLAVDKPLKVIFCQAERSIKEPLKRIKLMLQDEEFAGKILLENFTLTTELQGKDVSNHEQADELLESIKKHSEKMGGVDIVFFDPLYALVRGDLREDKSVNGVFSFFRRIGSEIGASVFFFHHENRGNFDKKKKKRIGQDFYGNKFISGLCTAIWHMHKDEDDKFKTYLINEKDSESCLISRIGLVYAPENATVRADVSSSPKNRDIMIEAFLKKRKDDGKHFSQFELFSEIHCQLHESNQRRVLGELIKGGRIKNIAPHGMKGSYVVL